MMTKVMRWRGAFVMVVNVLRMRGAASPIIGMFGCCRKPNVLEGVAVAVGDGVFVGVAVEVAVGKGVGTGVSV